MDAEEFLRNLQIVELTRDQPKLKVVHDWFLKICEDHVEEIAKKLEERKKKDEEAAKAEEAKKAVDKPKVEEHPQTSMKR